MNNIVYINAIKNALAINEDERKVIEQYQKMALDNPDNVNFKIVIGSYEFMKSFFLPLLRVFINILVRILEENYNEWDISKNSFPLMTIESVFENMTHNISLDIACDIIIDKKLDCNTYAKSELKRSIKECNLQLFKDTIKEYNIDYKPASDLCSHLCLFLNMQRDMENENCNIEALSEEKPEEDISLMVRAIYEYFKLRWIMKLKQDGYSDDDINEIKPKIEIVSGSSFDFSSIDTLTDFFIIIFDAFNLFVNSINDCAKQDLLNEYDKHLIGNFIEKKKAEMPIVHAYFTSFTKGDIFGDDFVLVKADHTEFLKMIEQCVSIETSEQQKLLDNKSNDICNYELVANPEIEELPLLKDFHYYVENPREIIMRAIKKGYMELVKVGEDYKYNWKSDKKNRLEYFCGRLLMGDHIKSEENKKNQWIKGESKQKFPRKPLSELFLNNGKPLSEKNLNDRARGTCPKKYEDIDELFE